MSYQNYVVNGPKKGKKKAAKKSGKKKAGKKKSGKKKSGKKKAAKKKAGTKTPAAKKPGKKKAAKKKPGKKKAGKKKAAKKKPGKKKAASKTPAMTAPPIGRRPAATVQAPPIRAPKPAKKKKAAKRIKVDAARMAEITRGLGAGDIASLEQARRAGTGEKALVALAKRLRAAAKATAPKGGKKEAAKKAGKKGGKKKAAKKAGKKGGRRGTNAREATATGRRGVVPGDLPIRAGAVPSRRASARKAGCRPGAKPPVRCRDRPTAASSAACSSANARWNKERRDAGEPTRSTKRTCGPGVPDKRASGRLMGHRKAAKIGPKTQGTRKTKTYTEAEQRKIMNRFLRS